MRAYSSSLSFALSAFFSLGLLLAAEPSMAGFRIQQYAPELRWMAQPTPEKAKVEAAIVAPRGLSCYLPSETGFCTIPLLWLTEQNDPASLWRELNGNRIKLATGYDGQVNATVRLGQTPKYEVIQGTTDGGKVLDSAILSAIWDPVVAEDMASQKKGELTVQDEGDCQIVTGRDYCEVELSWTTQNVTTASLWQRTAGGLVSVYEGAKEASMKVAAYETASIYELREGRAIDGQLLAATMTKGHRVQASGELTLPDGASCGLAPGQVSCDIRVSWTTNDVGRLWLREKPMSAIKAQGQSLVTITASGGTVDLRAGGLATGAIMDRANLSTVPMDNAGRIETLNGIVCEIPYSDTSCEQGIRFEIEKGEGTLWSATGESLASGETAQLTVRSTEYGEAYHLRAGTDVNNPILATYLAKGIKQTYRGSIKLTGADTCTFDVQGGSCSVPAEYEATDKASIWEVSKAQVVSGGSKNGTVNLVVNDETGNAETTANFDLKIHGNYSPKLSDPVLGSVAVRGIQPTHTGQLTAPNGPTCNLLYSSNTCRIDLRVVTTAPSVTVWNDQTGQPVWYGGSIGTSNFSYSVAQGAGSYTLREGRKIGNKAFGSLTLTGIRPTYYAQLTMPSGSNCTVTESNANCTLSFKLNSNTTTRIDYRDITNNPNSTWVVYTSGLNSNASFNFTAPNVTANRTYEFRVAQHYSPYEPLDLTTATATINPQHSFTLTSTLPQPNSGMQCRAEWSTLADNHCINTTPITWNTTAPSVTACRRLLSSSPYQQCLSTTAKTTSFSSYWSRVDSEYALDFYEGNVSPSTAADADSKGYRRLSTHTYTPGRMAAVAEHLIRTDKTTYSCELADRDATSCGQGVTIKRAAFYDAAHQSNNAIYRQPFYYIAKKGSATVVAGPYSNISDVGTSFSVTLAEQPHEYELRIREDASPKVGDPVLNGFTATTHYRDVTGDVAAKRVNHPGYLASNYITNGAIYPYYFTRSLSGGNYSERAEDCLIRLQDSACVVNVEAQVSGGSRASLFVDGNYVASFTTYGRTDYDSKFVVNLPVGEHTIAIYDGASASSINNKLIDQFNILVRRPAYTGSLTPRTNDIQLSYYGETQGVAVDFNMNTQAYLYNKTTNTLIQGTSPNYGADERFRLSTAATATLGAGEHELELRTHADANDPQNQVLATAMVRLTHKPQTMAIRPYSPYPGYYETCPVSYQAKYCHIYYEYINAHTSSNGIAACIVSATGIRKHTEQNGYTSYTGYSATVREGDVALRFYSGKQCPSTTANAEGYPLLLEHPISPTAPQANASLIPSQYSAGQPLVTQSETEVDTWLCHQRYQGENCLYRLTVTPLVPNLPAQQPNAYYGVWWNNSFYDANSNTNAYSFYNYSNGATSIEHELYACSGNNNHYSNCPKAGSLHIKTIKVMTHLPDYTASFTTADGAGCMANFGGSACNLQIQYTTTSAYTTLLRDGTAIATLGSPGSYSASISLPAKDKGVATVLKVVDGNSTTNRVLATIEVYPEKYDAAIFKFTAPMVNNVLKSLCIKSHLTGETVNCEMPISYESDASTKYLISSGSISASEVSGNGDLIASGAISGQYPIFAGRLVSGSYLSINAYGDAAKSKSVGALQANYEYMQYSDDVLGATQPINQFGTNPDYGYSGNGWYYLSNNGHTLAVSGSISIDDIVLTAPAICRTSGSIYGYPNYCGLIDYRVIYNTAQPDVLSTMRLTTPSSKVITRLFYRRSTNIGTAEGDWSDPTVTINGVTRPLNLDGGWHYIDVNVSTATNIDFSWINATATARNMGLDVFAEYYTAP